jgi:hypothetical protein
MARHRLCSPAITQPMKKIALVILSSLAPFYFTQAELYKIPEEDSLAQIEFPDDWDVTAEGDMVNATSDDGEIYILVEMNDSDSIEGAVEEKFAFLKKNKVTVDKKTQKQTDVKINGMDVSDLSWDGKDKDGPCKISMSFVGVDKDHALVMLYWASPEAEKKYGDELTKILMSIDHVKAGKASKGKKK